MKTLSLILVLFFSQSVLASSFGKFKMTLSADILDQQAVVFLMNSQNEITIIEDEQYYEINSAPFFGEVVLNFRSGGDEDFIAAAFKLKDNKLLMACAAFIDLKNQVLSTYSAGSVDLSRWNTKTKKYESLITSELANQDEVCLKELTQNYDDFEQF